MNNVVYKLSVREKELDLKSRTLVGDIMMKIERRKGESEREEI